MHTPGPWKVFWAKGHQHMFIGIGTEDGEGITSIWRSNSEEAAANARLIAAAPELLAALQDCLREHGGYTIKGECERNACAAIAKATGK